MKPGGLYAQTRCRVTKAKKTVNGSSLFGIELSDAPRMPGGTVGHRWGEAEGKWNLEFKDTSDGSEISPQLSLLEGFGENRSGDYHANSVPAEFRRRGVPTRTIKTEDGEVLVTTVYDLLMAQFGVGRGLEGEYPADYDDEDAAYTPAWQEKFSGIDRKTVIKFAREWAVTATRNRRKMHGHHRCRHQPLVSQQPDVPLGDHRA